MCSYELTAAGNWSRHWLAADYPAMGHATIYIMHTSENLPQYILRRPINVCLHEKQ